MQATAGQLDYPHVRNSLPLCLLLHRQSSSQHNHNHYLTSREVDIMVGVLSIASKTVRDCMVPWENVSVWCRVRMHVCG